MLLDGLWFGFWEYWHCENFGLGLYECVHGVCGKKFIGICKLYFMDMAKFCGYVRGYIYGYWQAFVGMEF